MRFLCLHGLGTNSEVFRAQTVALRYEMDMSHDFDFVEGTIAVPLASDLKTYYHENDAYFNYFQLDDTGSIVEALNQLHAYIATEGPYDGVLAYSHGAGFAATYIIQQSLAAPTLPPPFKCAIFISGGIPADPIALESGRLRLMNPIKDGTPLKLATAHIWGTNDNLYPGTSETLSNLCDPHMKSVFLHQEGHNVPSTKAPFAVIGAVKAIRRAIDQALRAQ